MSDAEADAIVDMLNDLTTTMQAINEKLDRLIAAGQSHHFQAGAL